MASRHVTSAAPLSLPQRATCPVAVPPPRGPGKPIAGPPGPRSAAAIRVQPRRPSPPPVPRAPPPFAGARLRHRPRPRPPRAAAPEAPPPVSSPPRAASRGLPHLAASSSPARPCHLTGARRHGRPSSGPRSAVSPPTGLRLLRRRSPPHNRIRPVGPDPPVPKLNASASLDLAVPLRPIRVDPARLIFF
nr:basic salivary proline-rich protein 4-like [Aegilops tauschii subsp. strangulata]